ncbi:hypothetical protein Mgra_00002039 [Meloidogyne graminicola]|uniref:Uncharacterized protein n=1 Tax=Meloidogyne graminicola TaxID=189291 RepID=A0A8S9ZXM2_9BILA|nr:hypothetical protein Mgra_00002039 [Meloidogyne graminicola]
MEERIREICDKSLFKESIFSPVNLEHLIAADSNLLFMVKASSKELRKKTKVHEVCDFKLPVNVLPDREGRTEIMAPLQRKKCEQQEFQRAHQSFQESRRGIGDRGGGDCRVGSARGGGRGGYQEGGECYQTYANFRGGKRGCNGRERDMPVPKTPDHYWDIDYPTLSEQLERGYLTVATSPLFKKHCSHPRRNIFKE